MVNWIKTYGLAFSGWLMVGIVATICSNNAGRFAAATQQLEIYKAAACANPDSLKSVIESAPIPELFKDMVKGDKAWEVAKGNILDSCTRDITAHTLDL